MKPEKTTLVALYVDEKKPMADIGEMFGVHATQVRRWLISYGIPTRSYREARLIAKPIVLTDADRAKMRANAALARTKLTPEARKRQGAKMRGRDPWNKGKSWTTEERAKHAVIRTTDEYREKLAAAHRGENSHLWRGGKTPDSSLQGWAWRKLRREVYERDNWTCQDCGCRCLNTRDAKAHPMRKIQAHHIVGRRVGGSDDLSNLVTLCMSCHHKRERAASAAV